METIYYVYLNAVYCNETDDYSYFYTIEELLQNTPISIHKLPKIYNLLILPTYIKRKRDFRILIYRAIHNKPTEEIINQEIRRLYAITERILLNRIQEYQGLFNQLQQFNNPDPQEIKGDILYHYGIQKINEDYVILEKAMLVERMTPKRVYLKQTAETKRKYINSKDIYTNSCGYAFCKNSSYIKRYFENRYYNTYRNYTKDLLFVKQFQKIMDDISL